MHKHMPYYQQIHRHEHYSVSIFCTVLYGVISCEPSSHLLVWATCLAFDAVGPQTL